MVKFIPNLITLLNLISGCLAIVSALEGDIHSTIIYLSASLVFDFADGLVARLLNAYSDMGKELDSLADLVSFGVAPAFLVRWYLIQIVGQDVSGILFHVIVNIPFVMVAATAYRLARFNLDIEQSTVFKGLPAPANALSVIAFLQLINKLDILQKWSSILALGLVLVMVFFQSYILVSKFPMFALKFSNYSIKDNIVRYTFILMSLVAFVLMGFSGFFPVVMVYICVSIIQSFQKK